MAFVKLDTGILDSTLWLERDLRDVFLTALLMAEPREFTEPQAQLAVDSMEPTGFIAPPGWYGFCPSAGVGIVRRSLADPKAGMEALRELGNPDPESRSQAYEGRRMIRINRGYLILNYMLYRDWDYTAAQRMRKLRTRRKGTIHTTVDVRRNVTVVTPNIDDVRRNVTVVTPNIDDVRRNVTVVHPNVTHAEAEYRVSTSTSTLGNEGSVYLSETHENGSSPGLSPGGSEVEIPAGMSEAQCAYYVLEMAVIASGEMLRRRTGNAIALLAKEEGCDRTEAARRMLDRLRRAAAEGPRKWLAWMEDGGWKKTGEASSQGHSMSSQEAEEFYAQIEDLTP